MKASSLWIYIGESLVLTIIAAGAHHVKQVTKRMRSAGEEEEDWRNIPIPWKRYLAFFLINMALFIFLDWVTPSLIGNIRGGYGYMIGVALMGILDA